MTFRTECAMVPFFVVALCYSSWGYELLSPLSLTKGIHLKIEGTEKSRRCKREEKSHLFVS